MQAVAEQLRIEPIRDAEPALVFPPAGVTLRAGGRPEPEEPRPGKDGRVGSGAAF